MGARGGQGKKQRRDANKVQDWGPIRVEDAGKQQIGDWVRAKPRGSGGGFKVFCGDNRRVQIQERCWK